MFTTMVNGSKKLLTKSASKQADDMKILRLITSQGFARLANIKIGGTYENISSAAFNYLDSFSLSP